MSVKYEFHVYMGPFSKIRLLLLCMPAFLNLEGALLAPSTADKGAVPVTVLICRPDLVMCLPKSQ